MKAGLYLSWCGVPHLQASGHLYLGWLNRAKPAPSSHNSFSHPPNRTVCGSCVRVRVAFSRLPRALQIRRISLDVSKIR